MTNPKVVVLRQRSLTKGSWTKNLKKVKISKSLSSDFIIGINQIDHEESENNPIRKSINKDFEILILGALKSVNERYHGFWTVIFGFPIVDLFKLFF